MVDFDINKTISEGKFVFDNYGAHMVAYRHRKDRLKVYVYYNGKTIMLTRLVKKVSDIDKTIKKIIVVNTV